MLVEEEAVWKVTLLLLPRYVARLLIILVDVFCNPLSWLAMSFVVYSSLALARGLRYLRIVFKSPEAAVNVIVMVFAASKCKMGCQTRQAPSTACFDTSPYKSSQPRLCRLVKVGIVSLEQCNSPPLHRTCWCLLLVFHCSNHIYYFLAFAI